MIGDRPVEHMDGVIDERTRVRQILSFISTVILSDETQKFAVKECVYNVILGLSFQEPVPSNFSKWIREAGADVIPKYRGWNTFISERGPYVFEIVTHTNPRLHSFPSNDKQLKESVIRSTQAATEYVYEQVSQVRTQMPCGSASIHTYSYSGTLQSKPNLIYLSNTMQLTNDMPCIVYRPTLNELQMKSKLFLPRIHSQWKKEEMKLLLQTTAISNEGKFTSIPKRGLFVWFQTGWNTTGSTKGIVQETLENGDIVIVESGTQAKMVVPPSAIDETQPLKETEVRIGNPIWALLHIHPKGFVTLTSTGSNIESLQHNVSRMITLDEDGWKPNFFNVTYTTQHKWNRKLADSVLNSIRTLKSFCYEKRKIVPIGNSIEWFSKGEQVWKKGTVNGYPDLRSYTIKTSKGLSNVPWTSVREPKDKVVNTIELMMERVNHRKFQHPLSDHIIALREKGYNLADIQQNLHESFSIDPSAALGFITESLESSQLGNPGVSVDIPVYSYESNEVPIRIYGKHLSDIMYTFRIIQVLLLVAVERDASSSVKQTATETEDDDIGSILLDDDDDDDDILEGLDLDDIDIDEEVIQLKEAMASGGDADSIVSRGSTASGTRGGDLALTFSTNLSIFLQSLYDRDPTLFNWQSRVNRKDRYTTICQENSRHPKLMTNETKIEVDTNHPGAYGLSSFAEAAGDTASADRLRRTEKSCDGVSEVVEKGEACVAIFHGSGQDKSWYICPRIYDLLDQKPLRLQDLDFEAPFIPKGWKKSDWRVDASGRDITQFEPTYKGRGLIRNLKQSDYNENSLYIAPMKAKYFFPGFLASSSHPKLLSMPCCFISPNKRLEELYGIQGPKKAGSANYMQGWKKTLGWDPPRLGLITPSLRASFDLHPDLYRTGNVTQDQKGKPLWLRRGIPYSPNPFISCLANASGDDVDEIHLRATFLDSLNDTVFQSLNGGLLGLYLQDTNGHIRPIHMFRNHILFGTNLSWMDFLDAYCATNSRKEVWILIDATDSLRPTMINTSAAVLHENRLKQLFLLQNRGSPEAKEWRVHFAIKQGLSWNPLYKIKQTSKSYDVYRGIPGNDPQSIYWVTQRVRRVRAIQKEPYIFSHTAVATYPSPNDYLQYIRSTLGEDALASVSPVTLDSSILSPQYATGWYHETVGFLPFYLQKLTSVERAISLQDILTSKPRFSVDHYIQLFATIQKEHATSPLLAAIRSSDSSTVDRISTIYGIEIPVKQTDSSRVPLPVLVTTQQDWNTLAHKRLEGKLKSIQSSPVPIRESIRVFQRLETEFGSADEDEKPNIRRYIPYYFQEISGTIVALTLKVMLHRKMVRTITIPVQSQTLTHDAEMSLRKQVGIRPADKGCEHGLIQVPDTLSLSQCIQDLNEIRLRTKRSIPCAPIHYVFSPDGSKVIGIEDETGTKYVIKKPISTTAIDPRTHTFILEPLCMSKYTALEEQSRQNEIQDILNDEFITLMQLPYWKDILTKFSTFAQTRNIWNANIESMMGDLHRIEQELHKRRSDIPNDTIRRYLYHWVAKVGWNDDLLENVANRQLQKTVSMSDFKTTETELFIESTDITTFADIHSSVVSTSVVPLPLIETSQVSIPIQSSPVERESKEEEEAEPESDEEVEPETDETPHRGSQRSALIQSYPIVSSSTVEQDREPTDEILWTYFKSKVTKIDDACIIRVTVV